MTIKFTDDIVFGNILFEGAVFVFSEGKIYANPEIIEEEEEMVIFLAEGEEKIGTAVHKELLKQEEAIEIAMYFHCFVNIGKNNIFGWSDPTRKRIPQFCYWFVKQRGTRFWGHKVTAEQALDLCTGRKELRYWTNSNKAELVIVK